MLLLLYPARPVRMATPETIPVSLLNPPEREFPAPTRMPRSAPARPTKARTIVAKKESPPAPSKPAAARNRDSEKVLARSEILRAEPAPPPALAPTPTPRETIPEQSIIAERPLPTLKELLPPANWAATSRANAPVSLNTRDPVYASYFDKIKQLIETQWEYPALALRYGLQGRLSLEFTISADGRLDRLRLVRSSGSQLLDDEAVRAVKAASPFPPIPPWVQPNPLSVSASMEYHDNRLNYRFAR